MAQARLMSPEAMKERLMTVDKESLVNMLAGLASKNSSSEMEVVRFLANYASKEERDRLVVQAFVREVKMEMGKARELAVECCSGKFHMIDEAGPVIRVIDRFFQRMEHREPEKTCEIRGKLTMLVVLMTSLTQFNPEGKIYYFDGDRVANAMDKYVCALLDAIADCPKTEDGVRDMKGKWSEGTRLLLTRIDTLFRDGPAFAEHKRYGLFEALELNAGKKALSILRQSEREEELVDSLDRPLKKQRFASPALVV